MATVEAQIAALEDAVTAQDNNVKALVLIWGSVFVFFMHTGYAMITVGCVQPKNTKNILVTNVFDAAIGSIVWWLVGWGIAYGGGNGDAQSFMGLDGYALDSAAFRGATDEPEIAAIELGKWLLSWSFACTTTTIMLGAVAERITWWAYLFYSVVFLAWVHPCVVHWAWSDDGWASPYRSHDLLSGCGVLDYAGSAVIHMSGGAAALVGSILLGSRRGRFIEGIARELPKVSWVYQTMGTLIVWFGWFGMVGAVLYTHPEIQLAVTAGRAMLNTAIAAGTSCLTSTFVSRYFDGVISSSVANNGILSGLVAIAASCSTVEPEAAFVIGLIGGLVYYCSSELLLKFEIDDVVNATPVHLFCGAWGILAPGFFTSKSLYAESRGPELADECCGVFYGCGGKQLGANLCFLVVVQLWTMTIVAGVLLLAQRTVGLRVTDSVEGMGMDLSKHGGLGVQYNGVQQLQHMMGPNGAQVSGYAGPNSFPPGGPSYTAAVEVQSPSSTTGSYNANREAARASTARKGGHFNTLPSGSGVIRAFSSKTVDLSAGSLPA